MVPSYYFILKELPINVNGKVERKTLPKISLRTFSRENYVPPTTLAQKKIADIWKKRLGVNRLGIHYSFYELGGTSVLIVKLLGEIYKAFGIRLSIHDVINAPTIEKLSKLIGREKTKHTLHARALLN